MKRKKILLFDGNNLIFRSFFAIKELSTANGVATNAVYGVLKSFRSAIQQFKPDYVIFCWDSGQKTFRHEQDATYKANRPAVQNDLKVQFPIVQEALDCLSIPQITAHGVECDDMIGTIATKTARKDFDVIIVSSDKDFFQLCTDKIKVFSYVVRQKNDNGLVDADYIREHFKVEPWQLVDIKSLTGEKTDNITGVKGIGPKIATKLIQQYGTIFDVIKILQNNPNLPERYKVIVKSIDIIANAYTLAKIKCDVVIPEIPVVSVDQITIDENRLTEFFERYEMKSFLAEMHSWRRLFNYSTSMTKGLPCKS